MSLKNTMLSERTQTQKLTYCKILSIKIIQNRQVHRDRIQIGGCGGCYWKETELGKNWLMGKRFYSEAMEMFVFKRKNICCHQTEVR